MVEFKVGAPFPMFKNYQKREGAVLEVSKEGGYFLPIYLNGMLPEEINAIKTGTIEFRVYEDSSVKPAHGTAYFYIPHVFAHLIGKFLHLLEGWKKTQGMGTASFRFVSLNFSAQEKSLSPSVFHAPALFLGKLTPFYKSVDVLKHIGGNAVHNAYYIYTLTVIGLISNILKG